MLVPSLSTCFLGDVKVRQVTLKDGRYAVLVSVLKRVEAS